MGVQFELVRDRFIAAKTAELAYRNHGDLFVVVVAGNTRCARIQSGLAINQKPVLMVSMREWNLQEPPGVEASLHCKRSPIGEIALKLNELGVRRMAVKIYWFGHVPGRIRP